MLRGGSGFVPKADTVIEAGDEVLLVLDPGLEESITAFFAPDGIASRHSLTAGMAILVCVRDGVTDTVPG